MTTTSTDRRNGVNIGSAIKVPCKAATTANIILSGEQTVDGVALVTGDRCLVKDQTDGIENGIYEVSTSAWQRTKDWDGDSEVKKGTLVFVHSGSTNQGWWYVSTADTITVGTTSVTIAGASTALAVVSAFVQTLLDDATAGDFLTTLGITAFAQTLLDDATSAAARTTLGAAADANVVHLAGDETITGNKTSTGHNTFQGRLNSASAIGGVDVNNITATFAPAFTALVDKMRISVRATGANTSAVLLNVDGLANIAIEKIVNGVSVPLVAGDIAGASHNLDLVYHVTGVWVLLNPSTSSYQSTGDAIAATVVKGHGLGAKPNKYEAYLKCTSADHGYSANAEVPISGFSTNTGTNTFAICADTANITVLCYTPTDLHGLNLGTGLSGAIDETKWTVIVRAWK